jgi:alkaline phosphatase
MLGGPLTVIMGAGHPEFDNNGARVKPITPWGYRYVGGQKTWEALKEGRHLGWTLIETRRAFEDLAHGRVPSPAKVLGVAQAHNTLQQKRAGDGLAPPYAEPLNPQVPTLAVMTRAALNVLAQNPKGFFLMVEGGAVDWACHEHQLGRMIEEELDFDAAVAAAVKWVESHGGWENTLFIVTGDHETGHLWGPGSGNPHTFAPLVDQGPGTLPKAAFYSDEHTNALVPLYAKGVCASRFFGFAHNLDPKRGPYVDNTAVFQVMLGRAAPQEIKKGEGRGEAGLPKAAGF